MAIVHVCGPEDSILLIRRAEREGDPWSGHWSFPGGRRDPQDVDLVHTALRELAEECGIRLGREHMEAALPPTPAGRKVGRFLLVAPFLFRVDRELPAVLNPREAVESLWVRLSTLRDPAQHSLRPVPGLPQEMLFRTVELSGLPLWGFTYRVITDWLDLGPKHCPIEQAGFEAARLVLEFLLSQGLTLKDGWKEGTAQQGAAKVATVRGVIPVAPVLAHFSALGRHVLPVHLLEVRPDYICVTGLTFEQYCIYACAEGAHGL